MAISKWGKKVDKVLESPPPEPVDIQEQISKEAARIEVEETKAHIQEWITRRLERMFVGCLVTVRRDEACAWYFVTVDYRFKGMLYSAQRTLRDEEIYSAATSTQKWSRFLDQQVSYMTEGLRQELLKDGVRNLPTARLGMSMDMGTMASSFQTAGTHLNQFGIEARKSAEAAQGLSALQEEREAIESIKRTIADREQ